MTQPEAVRLADAIDPRNESEPYWRDREDAAAELRRLYAVNQELLEALEEAKLHIWLGDEKGVAANIKCHQIIDAISKAEGKT